MSQRFRLKEEKKRIDRAALDSMSTDQLKAEAERLMISVKETRKNSLLRDRYIEAIVMYYEKNPLADLLSSNVNPPSSETTTPAGQMGVLQKATRSSSYGIQHQVPGPSRTESLESYLPQFCNTLTAQMSLQQQLLERLIVATERNNGSSAGSATSVVLPSPALSAMDQMATVSANTLMNTPSRSTISSISPAQAVSILSTQIPEFGGKDEEDVRMWIQRVDKVSSIHQAAEDVILLAASSRLVGSARRWYNLGSGSMLESWQGFRDAIIKRFARRVLFHVAMQRIEARRWNYTKESFQEYAMDKLVLMHSLQLSSMDTIHLLINGNGSSSLRATAAALKVDTIDQFLDEMHNITSVSTYLDKKVAAPEKTAKFKETCKTCGKKGHLASACRSQEKAQEFCVYCKTRGHVRADCYKLKRKQEQSQQASVSAPAVVSSVQPEADPESSVAFVQPKDGMTLKLTDSVLNIILLNGVSCDITALLDTGNPISIVKPNVYKLFFSEPVAKLKATSLTFTTLNNTALPMYGSIRTSVCFKQLPDITANINLYVLKENVAPTDVIIGRDFLKDQRIAVLYDPANTHGLGEDKNITSKAFLFSQLARSDVVCSYVSGLKEALHCLTIDFDASIKKQLVDLILNVEHTDVQRSEENDYNVTIALKDNTTYAYAPRRFA